MKLKVVFYVFTILFCVKGFSQHPFLDTNVFFYGDERYMEKIAPVTDYYKFKENLPNGVIVVKDSSTLDTLIIAHVRNSVLNGAYISYEGDYSVEYGSYLNGEKYGMFVEKLYIQDGWYYNVTYYDSIEFLYLQVEW